MDHHKPESDQQPTHRKRTARSKMHLDKRNKGEPTPNGTPTFVRKIFDMISTCDYSIASWHDDGTTFVVKDIVKFAAEVIPTYFKHSNFSSFVRQLNFYGFRKLKSTSLRIDETPCEETKYWTFRHEKFQQGSPCLLSHIRKNTGSSGDSTVDVEKLKKELIPLREALSKTRQDVANLVRLVQSLMETQPDQHHGDSSLVPGPSNKNKRKAAAALIKNPIRSASPQAAKVNLKTSVDVVALLPPPPSRIPSMMLHHGATSTSAVRLAGSGNNNNTSGSFMNVASLIKGQKIDDELLLLMTMPSLSASSMTSIKSKAIVYNGGEPTTRNADWKGLDSIIATTTGDEDGVLLASLWAHDDDDEDKEFLFSNAEFADTAADLPHVL